MDNSGDNSEAGLTLYVIYDHPSDFPEHWVVRPQHASRSGVRLGEAKIADSLAEARRLLPPGLVNLGRYGNDDPKILEVWV